MENEVNELETRLQALVEKHLARTHEIIQAGYDKSQAICDEAIGGFKRRSGVRSAMLDKALKTMGVSQQ